MSVCNTCTNFSSFPILKIARELKFDGLVEQIMINNNPMKLF